MLGNLNMLCSENEKAESLCGSTVRATNSGTHVKHLT